MNFYPFFFLLIEAQITHSPVGELCQASLCPLSLVGLIQDVG